MAIFVLYNTGMDTITYKYNRLIIDYTGELCGIDYMF